MCIKSKKEISENDNRGHKTRKINIKSFFKRRQWLEIIKTINIYA